MTDYKRHEKAMLIRPEYLNHAGTVFGGFMMNWADEMAYIAALLTFPHATFVTRLFGQFDFLKPVNLGDLIKIYAQVENKGTTSCKVKVWAVNMISEEEVFNTFAVMVNVRNGKKNPI